MVAALSERARRHHGILRGQPEKKVVDVCKRNSPDRVVVIQDVLPEVVDECSQLQRVPAASVKEVTAPGEDFLREICWSSVRSHGRHAADVDGSDLFPRDKRILRADQPRGGRIFGVSSAQRPSECAEQRGRKDMVFRKRRVLVPAEAEGTELRIIERVGLLRIVNRVAAKQAVGAGKNVVYASLAIVISGWLCEGKRELVTGKIRHRKQIQDGPHHGSHSSAVYAG